MPSPFAGARRQLPSREARSQHAAQGTDTKGALQGPDRQQPRGGPERQHPRVGLDRQAPHAGPDRQGPHSDNRHGSGNWKQGSQHSMQAPPERHASQDRRRNDEGQLSQLERLDASAHPSGPRRSDDGRHPSQEPPKQHSGRLLWKQNKKDNTMLHYRALGRPILACLGCTAYSCHVKKPGGFVDSA